MYSKRHRFRLARAVASVGKIMLIMVLVYSLIPGFWIVKSANVEPKYNSDPHLAASFGYICCGKSELIITMKPKLETP